MKIAVEPVALSPDEPELQSRKDVASVSVHETLDARRQRRGRADVQNIGLWLVTNTPAPPQKIREAPLTRDFWSRLQQAYAILRGTAYARPLRQPRLVKADS
jgi:hypothetical protein